MVDTMTMDVLQALRSAQSPIDFVGGLYRSASAERFVAGPVLISPQSPGSARAVTALLSAEDPVVVRAAGMMVFDVHRLPPDVDVYIKDDGGLVACESGTITPGLTMWHDLFTILRGPDLQQIVESLIEDGQHTLTTLHERIMPEFIAMLKNGLESSQWSELDFALRTVEEDFFAEVEAHFRKLQRALAEKKPQTTAIEAYQHFCDYLVRTLVTEPRCAMRAVVAAAQNGDRFTVVSAIHRWPLHPRAVVDLCAPVLASIWPLLAREAVCVTIDHSAERVLLGEAMDPNQLQHCLYQLIARRVFSSDGHRADRFVHIAYDAATGSLRICDNGYPINQYLQRHWIEEQARDAGFTAHISSEYVQHEGHRVLANVITLKPIQGELQIEQEPAEVSTEVVAAAPESREVATA